MATRSFLRELNKNIRSPTYYRELVQALDEREAAAQSERAIRLHPRLIAESVRHEREKKGWKQDALASLAKVSLSTLQRIERAESVTVGSLRRVETALRLSEGTYSEPRIPKTKERLTEILDKADKIERDSEKVKVSRAKNQRQILSLVRCRIISLDIELPDEGAKKDLSKLRDEIELASLVYNAAEAGILRAIGHADPKRKPMYRDILDSIRAVETKHKLIVRCGVYKARICIQGSNSLEVAVLNVRSRTHDPASMRAGYVFLPKALDGKSLWMDFKKRMNSEISKLRQSNAHV